tara:strand:+ start:9717 stop:11249 length:1533 start_codon:yes stop_codon:yes gene_type:complete
MAFSAQIFGPNTGISIADRKQAASMGVKAASQGRGGDKYNIKATPFTANLLKNMGGSSSFNPETGEMEFWTLTEPSTWAGGSNYEEGAGFEGIGNFNASDNKSSGNNNSSSSSSSSDNGSGQNKKTATPKKKKTATPKVVSQTTAAPKSAATNEKGDGWFFGFDSPLDAIDGGGAGRAGSTYSTEGSSFDPDGINNYVDPADNVGLGGADGMGNSGNQLTTISNMLGGNFTSVKDYRDGGGPGGASPKFIGGGVVGDIGNFLGGPERLDKLIGSNDQDNDDQGNAAGNIQTSDIADIAVVVEGELGQKYGLEMRNGRVVYSSTGANYQGGLDVNGERQEFLDGQAVTAAQKAAYRGGDDDGGASRQTFGNYIAGSDAGGQSSGQNTTDDFAIRYESMEPSEAAAAINSEIASLEAQIDAISNSGSGEDTSVMEAEIASLRDQLLSYGVAENDTSGVTMIDPSTGGGFVRREVIDRETGEIRYVEVPLSVDSGQDEFRDERRKGFGSSLYA